MQTLEQIQNEVRRYLSGDVPLYSLEDAFVDALWEADPKSNPRLAELVGSIHIALAQYADGGRSLDSLRRELANSIRPFVKAEVSSVADKLKRVEVSFGPIRKSPQVALVLDLSSELGRVNYA